MNKRPWEITMFAVLFIIGGVYPIIRTGIQLFNYNDIFKYRLYMSPDILIPLLVYIGSAVIVIAIGLLHIYIGVGLFKLKKRALKIVVPFCTIYILLIGISVVRSIIRFITYWRTAQVNPLIMLFIPLVIYSMALYYFKQPETKKYFAN